MSRMGPACVVWLLACALAGSCPAIETPEVQDLVISGGPQPIRVRLKITVDGRPWTRHRDELQQRARQSLFRRLDHDRDGALSATEARRLPPPRAWSNLVAGDGVYVAHNFQVLDANGDQRATQAEFDAYARALDSVPFRLVSVPGARESDELFRLLDTNRDQILTASEWEKASALAERDLDGNRVLSVDELRGPMSRVTPPEFVAVPSLPGNSAQWTFAWSPVGNLAADVELEINYLGDGQVAQRPKVVVRTSAYSPIKPREEAGGSAGEIALVLAGRRLVLRVLPCAGRVDSAARRQLQTEFDAVRVNNETFLATNATMPNLLRSVAALADANHDGQLERVELDEFLTSDYPQQVAADSAQLRLVQFSERVGVMPIADANGDGRLSVSELQRLPQRLAAVVPGSDRVERGALPPTILLVLQRGLLRDPANSNVLVNAGPAWFVHADRNLDGELDVEEFLGSPDDFRRLDANGDQRIDLDEAIVGDHVASENAP